MKQPKRLYDFVWGDECHLWLGKSLSGKLIVWGHRSDLQGAPPMVNELLGKGKSFKLSFLLIVNARTGCVWIEFLTGTQRVDPAWRHNASMAAIIAQRMADGPSLTRCVTP